jgi:ribonucleotide reductase class II
MVQELPRTRQQGPFPEAAPAAFPVFYRTYSRRGEVVEVNAKPGRRCAIAPWRAWLELGQLTPDEQELD